MDAGGRHPRRALRPQERRAARSRGRSDPLAADRVVGRAQAGDERESLRRRVGRRLPPLGRRAEDALLVALFRGARGSRDLPERRPRPRPPERLQRARRFARRALREARRLGTRVDRDSARHDLGLLHAAGLGLGEAARRADARRGPPDALRDLLGPRQLGAVPRLRGRLPSTTKVVSPARSRRRATGRPAGVRARSSSSAASRLARTLRPARSAPRSRANAPPKPARSGPPRRSGRRARGVARRGPVHRLRRAVLQLPTEGRGPVRDRALELRPGDRRAASLPLRLHGLERQPLRAAGNGLQGDDPRGLHRVSCGRPERHPGTAERALWRRRTSCRSRSRAPSTATGPRSAASR